MDALQRFDLRLFTLGGSAVTLWDLTFVLVASAVLVIVSGRLRRFIERRLERHTHIDAGTRLAVGSLVRYTVLVVGFLAIIDAAGIRLTSVSVLAGAVGVGVGFGLQNILSNFISGLIVMIERPVRPGDRIEVTGVEGAVIEIGARATTLLTNENVLVIVPNQKLITENVKNWQHYGDTWHLRLTVAVDNESDAEGARSALIDAAKAHSDLLPDMPPTVRLALNSGSLGLELRVQTHKPLSEHAELISTLNFLVLSELRKRQIKLA
jgi:small-conductance mechanosensitive channel